MTSLFHFEDMVHCQSLPRAESLPMAISSSFMSGVLEHIRFPAEPRIERRRGCETVLTV